VAETLTIPAHFNGPPESGNGGYTCGRVAQFAESEVVEVSLRSPPPLDTPLDVAREDGRVEVRDGDTLVAEGRPAELLLEVPDPVSREEVAAAVERGREGWAAGHPFPTCVVCGPERPDGFGITPGPLPGRDGTFGACWTPNEDAPELVWAALDCPTSAPVANFGEGPPMVLASLTLGSAARSGPASRTRSCRGRSARRAASTGPPPRSMTRTASSHARRARSGSS
jgi:hypothetical protein